MDKNVNELIEKVKQGDLDAQYIMAKRYLFGDEAIKDYEKGLVLLLKSAQNNHICSTLLLAKLYINGNIIPRDIDIAINYVKDLAKEGNEEAQCYLGICYENKYMPKEAFYWIEKSANKGNLNAEYRLGSYYQVGYGVNTNFVKALKWYRKASIRGYKHASYELGNIYRLGEEVNYDYTKAIKYYEKAAIQGHKEAVYEAAKMYENGLGTQKDYKKAIEYYERNALKNHLESIYALGNIYEKGIGVEKDYNIAKEYYKKAASSDHSDSHYKLGNMYENGISVKKDHDKAIKHYEKSAYPEIIWNMGEYSEIARKKLKELNSKLSYNESEYVKSMKKLYKKILEKL